MARFRARKQDVELLRSTYIRTKRLLEDARESMTAQGVPESIAKNVVPELPELKGISEMSVKSLQAQFVSRSDFDRTIRYMGRLQREGRKDVQTDSSKGVTQLGYYGNLTAVKGDLTEDFEGVQLRYERKLLERNRMAETLRRLESMGIQMEKVPIEKSDPVSSVTTQAYSESRHPLYTYVPSNIESLYAYREAIARNESLAILPPEDTPEYAYVTELGSTREVRQRPRRMTPSQVASNIGVDTISDMRTSAYFENYSAVAFTTLPDEIASEIISYTDRIMQLTPQKRKEVYEMIADSPDDAGTIEYMYLDRSGTMSSKMKTILGFWRSKVAPMIDMKAKDENDMGYIEEVLEREGYNSTNAKNIYDEYQRRKKSGDALSVTFEDMKNLVRYGNL